MVWLKAIYEFASLFSYRTPDFSSQYALSSILPGPSTIKLAMVSTAIETTGNPEYGNEIFELIKSSEIKIQLPQKIAQTNVLIKRLKKKKEGRGFETTFGIRGYVHYSQNINVYINISESKADAIKKVLRNIRRFGTSDSLACCTNLIEEEPSETAVTATRDLSRSKNNSLIIPVKDINPNSTFEDVNVYSTKKRTKNVLISKIYSVPISKQFQGKNWMVYEF